MKKYIVPHLQNLQPYSNARAEFKGTAKVWLDANENPFDREIENQYNRYPDPLQYKLKQRIGEIWSVNADQIFLGNGSDEAIDLLIRLTCLPGKDKILVQEPTYSMYAQSAAINNVAVVNVPLQSNFSPDISTLTTRVKQDPTIKLLFLCSPNNPTGNCVDLADVLKLAKGFSGLVVVDEAYIDFALEKTALSLLVENENLVVLRTFSKAWGMAALRLGAAIANPQLVNFLNVVKPPYNINAHTQNFALAALKDTSKQHNWVEEIKQERQKMQNFLERLSNVVKVFPSEANFILVQFKGADQVYNALIAEGIVVRKRFGQVADTLRISVGTPTENAELKKQLTAMANN